MKKITVGYLYPEYMNIYGDTGNIISLINRGKLREIDVTVKGISASDTINPNEVDIYFFGGGQDNQQVFVSKDIQRLKSTIQEDISNGAVALTICGGYQLFGKFYRPFEGEDLEGIEIFPLETFASSKRMINNIVVEMDADLHKQIKNLYPSNIDVPTTLVGFENHSGQTQLEKGTLTLGKVIYGFGNNESKEFEGCRVKNAFGTYMHGSLLPKNPHFTDYLLSLAIKYRYDEDSAFGVVNDLFATRAHKHIVTTYHA